MKYLLLMLPLLGAFQPNVSTNKNELNEIIITQPTDECFDELMYTWFIQFHKMQEDGQDMNHADQKAAMEAINMFNKCKN